MTQTEYKEELITEILRLQQDFQALTDRSNALQHQNNYFQQQINDLLSQIQQQQQQQKYQKPTTVTKQQQLQKQYEKQQKFQQQVYIEQKQQITGQTWLSGIRGLHPGTFGYIYPNQSQYKQSNNSGVNTKQEGVLLQKQQSHRQMKRQPMVDQQFSKKEGQNISQNEQSGNITNNGQNNKKQKQ